MDTAIFADNSVFAVLSRTLLWADAVKSDSEVRRATLRHLSGETDRAEAICRSILARQPQNAEALHLLATMARQQGRFRPAATLARMAVESNSSVAAFHNTLGMISGDLREWENAAAAFAEATRLQPVFPEAHYNLGTALAMSGRLVHAAIAYEESTRLRPANVAAFDALLAVYQETGDLEALLTCKNRIVDLRPNEQAHGSSLLYATHYKAGCTPSAFYLAHLAWAERHAEPLSIHAKRISTNVFCPPERRLRVGYVSTGFSHHPIGRFQEAALRHRDAAAFEVFCYSSSAKFDALTARLQSFADHWRDVRTLSDADLAERVWADGINILVDLDGHDSDNRLLAFARRPAPVQVTYNGSIDTTGMSAMDWRITDALHDPPGATERFHTERLYRLPAGNWCYTPDADAPPVGGLPANNVGHVTFGCLNRFLKVNQDVRQLWSRILQAIPEARLAVSLQGEPTSHKFPLALLERDGIPADRVIVVGQASFRNYLQTFNRIDIALDPFPFNGITTTCDALWMGVPVVTLAGETFISRGGVSLLTNVGLPELIARTPDEYVEIAVGLASDPTRLAALRAGLRERMVRSPVCDGPRFARALEDAYRHMWADRHAGGAASGGHQT